MVCPFIQHLLRLLLIVLDDIRLGILTEKGDPIMSLIKIVTSLILIMYFHLHIPLL